MRRILVAFALAASAATPARAEDFATVDGTVISATELDAALASAVRQKFYHREVPEAQLDEFRREVAQGLIDRVLLQAEARRRGLAPDAERVRSQIAEYDRRYGAGSRWQQNREAMLPQLERMLGDRDVLERLQAGVREVEAPDEAALVRYYETHRELFTEPEQTRISVILLKVDPSAPKASWIGAEDEAGAIRKRLVAGADFADAARMHSGDASAAKGGDLGYLHQGMMPEGIYEKLGAMQPGELSEPVRLLEGVALFRLAERRPARLRALEEVKERAAQLWRRDEGERRWQAFLSGLRAGAAIRIDTARYPALATLAGPGSGTR
jgi:parvulin-like peptidyl-prolyl isomerase